MVDFVLNIRSTIISMEDFCEPDSETVTSDARYPAGYGDSIQKYPGAWGQSSRWWLWGFVGSVRESFILSDSVRTRCFFDWLTFVWIWVYLRFSVSIESKSFIRLTPNRSKDCERHQFLFKYQLALYSLALWFRWCFYFSDCLVARRSSMWYLIGRVIANTFLVRS